MGQRLTGMTSGQKSFPVVKSLFKFAQHGKLRHVGQRIVAAHRQHCRRHLHYQDRQHRGHQPRPGDHVHPNRLPATRPALHGLVAQLRPRHGEPESAGVHRHDFQRQGKRPTALHAPLGLRLPALRTSGRAVSRHGRSGVVSLEPAGHRAPTRAAACSMAWRSSTRKQYDAFADPEINTRIAQYEMAYPHADLRAGARRTCQRNPRARSRCTGRT